MTEEKITDGDIFDEKLETANTGTTEEPKAEEKPVSDDKSTEKPKAVKKKKPKKVKPDPLPAEVVAAMASLEKEYGKGTVMQMGGSSFAEIRNLYPTPSLALDLAIGLVRENKNGGYNHGLPSGKIMEIYGPEASGKTTFCNHVIAAAQKVGGLCAMVDMENTWDPEYAGKLGVDTKNLIISQPDFGEQALNTAERLIMTGKFSVVVVDSIASLIPKAELDKAIGERSIGAQAGLMSQACRKLCALVNNTNTLLIFTNQIRYKIGVMFGNPETTPGGEAMKFFASLRMDIRRIGQIKNNDGEVIGHRGKITLVKNKLAPPYKKAEFDMMYGEGISRPASTLEMAVQHGLVGQAGSWFSYGEEKFQGKDNIIDHLKTNEEFMALLENEILQSVYDEMYNL